MSLIESIMNEQNSKFWWNEYFKKKWDNLDGRKQTRFFMQTIVSNLPNPVINKISKYRSVLDWGCALGQGVDVLTKTFTKTKIFGLDFSTIAIDKAKEFNMPKDNIERAIKRGAGELEGANIEEITYEAFGPEGIALIIKCITDNRNRTVSNIRHILTKHGGSLGEANTVLWMFEEKGVLRFSKAQLNEKNISRA